ncbi:MAG: hypothetical protein LVR00_02235 [Rhabdochlamydiaceae bacterium]|jgi:hypothetical protein
MESIRRPERARTELNGDNISGSCNCETVNEWARTVAFRALQAATEGFSLLLLRAERFSSINAFTDVKALTQGVGATFAGFDLVNVGSSVKKSFEKGTWGTLAFRDLPSGFLALDSIRTVAWRTEFPVFSPLSTGTRFLQKYISRDYFLFAAGLSVSCFSIATSAREIYESTDRKDPNKNWLQIAANVALTAYYALSLLDPKPSRLNVGLLAASTACTFFAGPMKAASSTRMEHDSNPDEADLAPRTEETDEGTGKDS